MQGAEIRVGAGCREGERIAVIGVECRRLERFVIEATVCGISSSFFQVTLVPALMVSVCGENVKLSIFTSASAARAGRPNASSAATIRAAHLARAAPGPDRRCQFHRICQPCNGMSMIARRCWPCLKFTSVMPSSLRSWSSGTFIGPGDGAEPGAGCGNDVDVRGVKRDVAFDLLHHLMDMAVEHRHRAEAFDEIERLGAVVGSPAPLLVDGPERNMGEHHDRLAGGASTQVILEPGELLRRRDCRGRLP